MLLALGFMRVSLVQIGCSVVLPPLRDGSGENCRVCCSVSGPPQSVQRAEIWREGRHVALQGIVSAHVEVDNLSAVRHVTRWLGGVVPARPFLLAEDGDSLSMVRRLLQWRGVGAYLVSKVKGSAGDDMVLGSRVRKRDRIGNDAADEVADEAADLGRRRVRCAVIDVRRNLGNLCARWHPIVRDLQHFFIAISGLW